MLALDQRRCNRNKCIQLKLEGRTIVNNTNSRMALFCMEDLKCLKYK